MLAPVKRAVWVTRALLLAALAVAAGCENALSPIPRDSLRGVALLDEQRSEVARFAPGAGSSGAVIVDVGQTRTFTVVLIGADDAHIPLIGLYQIRQPVQVVNGVLASVSVQGEERLRVTGRQRGSTTLVLDIWQGIRPVLTNADITVQVRG